MTGLQYTDVAVFQIKKSEITSIAYRAIRLSIVEDFLPFIHKHWRSQMLRCHDRANVSLISLSMSVDTVGRSLILMIFHSDVFQRSIS